MHVKRLISAAIFLPLFYLYIMKLPPIYFAVLLSVVSALGVMEFCSMYGVRGILRYAGMAFGVAIPAYMHATGSIGGILVFSLMSVASIRLFFKAEPSAALRDLAPVAVGLLYVSGLLSYQIGVRNIRPEWIIFLFGCVWGSDSFAYYIGKGIGKRKLYKEVSPNKTVAGAFGSVVGGSICAVLLNGLLDGPLSHYMAAFFGLALGAVTIVGDLVESMFKRDAGVKDSGSLIPGHGGILDKIDGAIFAGPLLYWLTVMLGSK